MHVVSGLTLIGNFCYFGILASVLFDWFSLCLSVCLSVCLSLSLSQSHTYTHTQTNKQKCNTERRRECVWCVCLDGVLFYESLLWHHYCTHLLKEIVSPHFYIAAMPILFLFLFVYFVLLYKCWRDALAKLAAVNNRIWLEDILLSQVCLLIAGYPPGSCLYVTVTPFHCSLWEALPGNLWSCV